MNPGLIRTHSSHPYQNPSNQVAAVDYQQPAFIKTLNFLNLVFTREPETYKILIHIMEESTKKAIHPKVTWQKLETLFADLPELLHGFRRFLSSLRQQPSHFTKMAENSTSDRRKDAWSL